MYLKILRGGKHGYNIKQLVGYAARESADASLLCHNLFIANPLDAEEISEAFEIHNTRIIEDKGPAGKRIRRPIVHIIGRAAPQDGELTNETLRNLAKDTLTGLGLDPSAFPYYAQSHLDDEGTRNHFHIIATRLAMDGKVWKGEREGERCWEIKTVLEKKYGLHVTESREEFEKGGGITLKRTHEEHHLKKRDEMSKKELMALAIINSIKDSEGKWTFFKAHLHHHLISVEKIERASGHHGIIFKLGDFKITGSKLGRHFSYSNIQKQIEKVKNGEEIEQMKLRVKTSLTKVQKQLEKDEVKKRTEPESFTEIMDDAQLHHCKTITKQLKFLKKCKYKDLEDKAAFIATGIANRAFTRLLYVFNLILISYLMSDYQDRERKRKHTLELKRSGRLNIIPSPHRS